MYRIILAFTAMAAVAAASLLGVTGAASAAVVATDDFQSYAIGSIIDQGAAGSGWGGAWGGLNSTSSAAVPIRDVSAGVMAGFGQSLELGFSALQTGKVPTNHNIVQRTFDAQTGTIYLGFAVKTVGLEIGGTGVSAGDMFHVYVNNTVDTSASTTSRGDSLACGIDFAPPPEGDNGAYFVRKGGDQTPTAFVHSNDTVHRMVMKMSKSGTSMEGYYDEVALWVDRETELATPDAARASVDPTAPLFDTISVLHVRLWGFELEDRVYLDSLRIATTYAEALPELPPVPTIPGDTDGNQIVDQVDAAVLAGKWGQNVGLGGFGSGDFNADQVVNAADASILAANWGDHRSEGAAAVPEPGMIGLAVGLVLAALARRVRR